MTFGDGFARHGIESQMPASGVIFSGGVEVAGEKFNDR